MPDLTNPFAGVLSPDRKLSKRELARAMRLSIVSEEDAISLYETLADATTDPDVKKVLQDVANEEKVHVGEFQKLVERLDSEEEELIEEGADELSELINEAKLAGHNFGVTMLNCTIAQLDKKADLEAAQIDQLLALLKIQIAPLVFLAVDVKAALAYTAFKKILENMKKNKQLAQEGEGNEFGWSYPVLDYETGQSTTGY